MQSLRKLAALSWGQQLLLLEALLLVAIARIAILVLPFRWIAKWLGRHMQSSLQQPENLLTMRNVQWAVKAMAHRVPWKAECLVQAMAARSMLQRRSMNGTLFLGVAKDSSSDELKAHAWLKCGDQWVTGGRGAEKFAVVSTFAFGQADEAAPSL